MDQRENYKREKGKRPSRQRRLSAPALMFFHPPGTAVSKDARNGYSENRTLHDKCGSFKSVLKMRPRSSPDLAKAHHVRFNLHPEGYTKEEDSFVVINHLVNKKNEDSYSDDDDNTNDVFIKDKFNGSSSSTVTNNGATVEKNRPWNILKRRLTKKEKRPNIIKEDLNDKQNNDENRKRNDDANNDYDTNNNTKDEYLKMNPKQMLTKSNSLPKEISLNSKRMMTRLEWKNDNLSPDGSTTDQNAAVTDTMPLLHVASAEGNYDLVSVLIDVGVDLNETDWFGWPALHYAICAGHYNCAALLIKNGVDIHQYTDEIMKQYVRTVRKVIADS